MTPSRPWLLPALLAAVQLAVWPGMAVVDGDAGAPATLAAGVAAILTVALALGWRQRSPLAVTAVVVAVVSLGTWMLPGDELSVISTAAIVALYGVAVCLSGRTTSLVCAGLILWQSAVEAAAGIDSDYPPIVVAVSCVYALVAAFGRLRQRWHAERAAAARRLADAEAARHRAADAERLRLARELHDVTAHHLTAIVVHASAAQLLGAKRPELRTDALDFAAGSGSDTVASLRRLVALMPIGDSRRGSPPEDLTDLADGFRRLGQRITVDAPPVSLRAPVAAAVHGIVREALTNSLRYAPGSAVRLTLRHTSEGTELIVDDDGAVSAGEQLAGLGGERGVIGMRERAEALGGTFHAGPADGGGWRVRALLPSAAPVHPTPGNRVHRWLHSETVIDVSLFLAALLIPLGGLIGVVEDVRSGPAVITLCLLALVAHAAPLLARRQRPWLVLTVLSATTWLGPLLVAVQAVPAGRGWLFPAGVGAELVAVYAAARWGARHALAWLAPLGVLSSAALAIGVLIAHDPQTRADIQGAPGAFIMVFMAVIASVVLAPLIACSWVIGCAVRARGQRLLAREDGAVAIATAHTIEQARAERARIAAGLREAVLKHAERVPRAAHDGDLTGVLGSARAALAAMRSLLDGLREPPTPEVAPPATLGALADRLRADGHVITLELAAALPTEVELAACRVAELLLADVVGRSAVIVDHEGDALRVTVTGGRRSTGDTAAELRARIGVLGGQLSIALDGTATVRVSSPSAVEAVSSSRSG